MNAVQECLNAACPDEVEARLSTASGISQPDLLTAAVGLFSDIDNSAEQDDGDINQNGHHHVAQDSTSQTCLITEALYNALCIKLDRLGPPAVLDARKLKSTKVVPSECEINRPSAYRHSRANHTTR